MTQRVASTRLEALVSSDHTRSSSARLEALVSKDNLRLSSVYLEALVGGVPPAYIDVTSASLEAFVTGGGTTRVSQAFLEALVQPDITVGSMFLEAMVDSAAATRVASIFLEALVAPATFSYDVDFTGRNIERAPGVTARSQELVGKGNVPKRRRR